MYTSILARACPETLAQHVSEAETEYLFYRVGWRGRCTPGYSSTTPNKSGTIMLRAFKSRRRRFTCSHNVSMQRELPKTLLYIARIARDLLGPVAICLRLLLVTAASALLPRRQQLLGERARALRGERVVRVVAQADAHSDRGRRHDLEARL